MKDSIIVYKSWLPLINSLPVALRIEFYDLLFAYDGLDTPKPVIESDHLKGIYHFIISEVEKPRFDSRNRLCYTSPVEWAKIVRQVYERDSYTCTYCGATNTRLECDHIIPFSKGGKEEPSNLTTACMRCNRQKKDRDLDEFLNWKQYNK